MKNLRIKWSWCSAAPWIWLTPSRSRFWPNNFNNFPSLFLLPSYDDATSTLAGKVVPLIIALHWHIVFTPFPSTKHKKTCLLSVQSVGKQQSKRKPEMETLLCLLEKMAKRPTHCKKKCIWKKTRHISLSKKSTLGTASWVNAIYCCISSNHAPHKACTFIFICFLSLKHEFKLQLNLTTHKPVRWQKALHPQICWLCS